MILLADIGNSAVKWGVACRPRDATLVLATPMHAGASGIERDMKRLLRREKPSALVVASVVPEATRWVLECANDLGVRAVELDYRAFRAALNCAVKAGTVPGSDRLANACALHALHPLPACAIDSGTAVTFDVVDASGSFVGGGILPGERLQIESLQRGAARLASVRAVPAKSRGIGTTTADAIAFAVHNGITGAALSVLGAIERELRMPLARVVVTGGGGKTLCAALKASGRAARCDEHLTLRGMTAAWGSVGNC